MERRAANTSDLFRTEKISRVLLKVAPPVMLAQLIQALYNVVDSLFVGRFSESGLTALSIIYPVQLFMIALAVGTGVGINTVMAARLGVGRKKAMRPVPARTLWLQYTGQIFLYGAPNMLMQAAYTFYIFGFNLILATFSDQAVTVLGLYYKWQSFFFILLGAMQTCIVPIVSYNYAAKNLARYGDIFDDDNETMIKPRNPVNISVCGVFFTV